MFTNILLAVDGSGASLGAAHHGIKLASTLKARVTVVTVTIPWATYFSRELAVVAPGVVIPKTEYDYKRETLAACILQNVATYARCAGVGVRTVHRSHQEPYQAIIEAAVHERCDLIVMGSHCDRGLSGVLLGSETMKVLTHTGIPVLVYRQN
jgi:nucleotide-binding universal stress UspA family protein